MLYLYVSIMSFICLEKRNEASCSAPRTAISHQNSVFDLSLQAFTHFSRGLKRLVLKGDSRFFFFALNHSCEPSFGFLFEMFALCHFCLFPATSSSAVFTNIFLCLHVLHLALGAAQRTTFGGANICLAFQTKSMDLGAKDVLRI